MARKDLYEFEDLLARATKMKYDWNEAHDILMKDNIPPRYEEKVKEHYQSDSTPENNEDNFCYSRDTCKILQAFFKHEGITEFCLV